MWLRTPLIPVALAFGAGIAMAGQLPLAVVWTISGATLVAAVLALALGRPIIAIAALLLDVTALGALRAAPLPLGPDHVAHRVSDARFGASSACCPRVAAPR